MHAATADAVIDAINEYIDAKITDQTVPQERGSPFEKNMKEISVAQLDRAHERLRHVLMTGIA